MPGKKYADAAKKYDKTQLHEPAKAFELVKSLSTRNFDESVEVAFKLGVDPRKADQMLRGTVSLPAGTGKDVRVAVFAAGDAAEAAREAGADVVGAEDLVNRIQNEGFMDFDIAIATPDLMGQVGARPRLGPRASCRTRRPARSPPTSASGQSSRAARSSTVPIASQRARADRQRASYREPGEELRRGARRPRNRPRFEGHEERHHVVDHGAGRQDRHRERPRPERAQATHGDQPAPQIVMTTTRSPSSSTAAERRRWPRWPNGVPHPGHVYGVGRQDLVETKARRRRREPAPRQAITVMIEDGLT
jgi:hypothetical protein